MSTVPGGNNTYIPGFEKNAGATGQFKVEFSRNPKDFPLNEWIQIIPVTMSTGRYLELTTEQAGRITDSNMGDDLWADGEDAPDDRGNLESFEFKAYSTVRRATGFRIGAKANEQAAWDVVAHNGRIAAQNRMTRRTQLCVTAATTSGNYPSGHYSAVTGISGVTGKWNESTSARLDIKKSLHYGVEVIRKATLGAVKMADLRWVISPGVAKELAATQELVDLIKQSPDALKYLKGDLGPNAAYGLPEYLYGLKVVIEDAVKVTSKKGATKATSNVLDDDTSFICARPGGLEAPENSNESARFSTFGMFIYEDMTVEDWYDKNNRVHRGRVIDDLDVKVTAGISGFLFTDVLA